MKQLAVKIFTGNMSDVIRYLSIDLAQTLRDLALGLTKLTFAENFDQDAQTFTVASGATKQLPNHLGTTNLEWIIVDISGDSSLVRDPTNPWTNKAIYFKNVGASQLTATVRFFRGS